MKTYIKVTILTFLIGMIFLVTSVFAWLKFTPAEEIKPTNSFTEDDETEDEPKSLLEQRLSIPKRTNFLIMGVDATELLADVIIVGSFNSETGSISLISVPRDTYTTIDSNMRQKMREDGIGGVPSTLKLNELHSYAGKEYGAKYEKFYLETLLGIEIHYIAEVNTKAFRDIVDAVGGIEMQIRDKGFYYTDPVQDLVINVPGGLVKLDGEQAEGVVRFRSDYALGDLERIEVQQEFLKQFIKQVLNKEAIMSNALEIFTTCINYVSTDFPVGDVVKYVPYIKEIDPNKVSAFTLPGEPKDILVNDVYISYFLPNTMESDKLINKIFYSNNIQLTEETLKEVKIQVLNGSKVSGLALETQEKMVADGYKVEGVGNYTGEKSEKTRVYVSDEVNISQFSDYFNDYEMIVDADTTLFYDVVIVLGTGEGLQESEDLQQAE